MTPRLELVREWLVKADADLRSANASATLAEPIRDTACFHCQQAVEKALKALLTLHEVPCDPVHSIDYLMDLCCPLDTELERYRLQGRDLTAYAVKYRYPGTPGEPSLQDLMEAIECTDSIYSRIVDCVPQECRPQS